MNDKNDWFELLDTTLDELPIAGGASSPLGDRAVAELLAAAQEFGSLAAAGGHEPDGAFVQRLEKRLLINARNHQAKGALPSPELAPHEFGGARPQAPFVSAHWLRSAALAAMLIVLILAAGLAVSQFRGDEHEESPRVIEAAIGSSPAGNVQIAAGESVAGNRLLWEISVEEGESSLVPDSMTANGDTFYRFQSITGFNGIEAVDGRTGETLWRESAYLSGHMLLADEGGVYFVGFGAETREGTSYQLVALDAETGAERWRFDLDRAPLGGSIHGGTIYLIDQWATVTAVDAEHPEILWTYEYGRTDAPGEPWQSFPSLDGLPVVAGNTVITLIPDGTVMALDRQSGDEMWRLSGLEPRCTRLVSTGAVVGILTAEFGCPRSTMDSSSEEEASVFINRLLALDPVDGEILWERRFVSQILEIVATDDAIAVVGSEIAAESDELPSAAVPGDGSPVSELSDDLQKIAVGFDPVSGKSLWTAESGEAYFRVLTAWQSITGDGSGIAALMTDGRLQSLGVWRGGELAPDPGARVEVIVVRRPIVGDFGFVVTLENGNLAAIAVNAIPDGRADIVPEITASADVEPAIRWTSPGQLQELEDISWIAVNGNALFRFTMTADFTGIEAIDGATSRQLWQEEVQWALLQPAADDTHLYYASDSVSAGHMTIEALDVTSGHPDWSLSPGRTVMGLSAADGVLYAEVSPNTLMAIRDGEILWESAIDPYVDPVSSNEFRQHMHGPVVTDGVVVGMAANGTIAGFDPVDGDRLWTGVRSTGPGSEYVVAGDVLVWFRILPVPMLLGERGTPVPDAPIRSEVAGANPNVDVDTLWRHETNGYSHPIGVVGDTVYFIEYSIERVPATPNPAADLRDNATGTLYALNARTGELSAVETRTGRAAFTVGAIWSPQDGEAPLLLTGSAAGTLTFVDSGGQTVVGMVQVGAVNNAVINIQVVDDVAYLLLEDGSAVGVSLAGAAMAGN